MKRTLVLAACALCFFACQTPAGSTPGSSEASDAAAAPAKPLSEDETVAWVNEIPIAKKLMDDMVAQMPPFMQEQVKTPEGMKQFAENLVGVELVYQQAVAEGFDKTDAVQDRLRHMRKQVIYGAYLDNAMKSAPKPDEAALRKFYEENAQLANAKFEDVKGQIEQHLGRQTQQQQYEKIVGDLKAKAAVRINDKLIAANTKPAEPPAEAALPLPGDAAAVPAPDAPKTE